MAVPLWGSPVYLYDLKGTKNKMKLKKISQNGKYIYIFFLKLKRGYLQTPDDQQPLQSHDKKGVAASFSKWKGMFLA